jgi:hypothetical protein
MIGIAIAVLILVGIFYHSFSPSVKPIKSLFPTRFQCSTNMQNLTKALIAYADQNEGFLPVAENWCDILVDRPGVKKSMFKCKEADDPSTAFSININVAGKNLAQLDPNMVMLFESDAGWNSSGGPELAIADRHTKGSNFSFVNGEVFFIMKEAFDKLTWENTPQGPNSAISNK